MRQLEEDQESSTNQYVIFKLHGESYGVSIQYVEIIEKVTHITRVPNAQPHVMGVINLRGEIVPVINLRKFFALPYAPMTDESRVIILSLGEVVVGFMTDSSSEVLTILQDNIENAPGFIGDVDMSVIKGIGKVEDRMIMMLDIQQVLALRHQDTPERGQGH